MALGPASAAYTTDRAASLAGVPSRTLYYWAKTELVLPSVSRHRVMRWSYADLLLIRLVDWLRQDKPDLRVAKTSMAKIRMTLDRAADLGERLLGRGVVVYVDQRGCLVLEMEEMLTIPLQQGSFQRLLDTKVNLVEAFTVRPGLRGPDLIQPRPTLRIVPGKLSGEPHAEGTRIPTNMVAALASQEFDSDKIRELYPALTSENIAEALELEEQLEENLHAA